MSFDFFNLLCYLSEFHFVHQVIASIHNVSSFIRKIFISPVFCGWLIWNSGESWSNEVNILMFNLIKSEKASSSKFVPQYPSLLIHIKWLSKYPSRICLYISFISIKLHISSLMLFAVNCPPKTILFKVWKRQFPSIPLGIILNWEVRAVALFRISSDSMENSEDSSVISSVKISLSHHFF